MLAGLTMRPDLVPLGCCSVILDADCWPWALIYSHLKEVTDRDTGAEDTRITQDDIDPDDDKDNAESMDMEIVYFLICHLFDSFSEKTFCGKKVKINILGFIEKVKYGAISFVFGSVRSPSILPISSFSENETQAIKQER